MKIYILHAHYGDGSDRGGNILPIALDESHRDLVQQVLDMVEPSRICEFREVEHKQIGDSMVLEIERLTSLLEDLRYCPSHGRVQPCEVCGFGGG